MPPAAPPIMSPARGHGKRATAAGASSATSVAGRSAVPLTATPTAPPAASPVTGLAGKAAAPGARLGVHSGATSGRHWAAAVRAGGRSGLIEAPASPNQNAAAAISSALISCTAGRRVRLHDGPVASWNKFHINRFQALPRSYAAGRPESLHVRALALLRAELGDCGHLRAQLMCSGATHEAALRLHCSLRPCCTPLQRAAVALG